MNTTPTDGAGLEVTVWNRSADKARQRWLDPDELEQVLRWLTREDLDAAEAAINDQRYVKTVQRLKQFFYVAHVHVNNWSCARGLDPFPGWAFEALLVNKRIGVLDPGQPPPPLSALAARNRRFWPDCQL